jgi:hypothetical protein
MRTDRYEKEFDTYPGLGEDIVCPLCIGVQEARLHAAKLGRRWWGWVSDLGLGGGND